ncbi:Transcriptional regulator [Pseudomonas cannabina pv. alisalensis]|uniref:Transcriptional regulator n=3 Tax=Pseudomonas syringae group TaxID=136849 RepID=A0AB37QBV6_PSECA|nr:Transcriptional regulator [Pseudomonas cannabina pv. alisalensis]RMN75279.1 Transcriptional regulator [Pseudomonas cannabina pv. alisalensis]RMN83217.1 Transcriptional regulator [Pseudomonas cannabina]
MLQYSPILSGRQFIEDKRMTGIGPRLKRERLRLKLSQSALGAIGGVETNAQGNYENGIRSPRADYLSRIADAGVDITYLVTGFHADPFVAAPPLPDKSNSERLNGVIARLHGSLHDVTQNLYQVARLMESNVEQGVLNSDQLDTIKSDAEAITIATVRLIYMTSKLK